MVNIGMASAYARRKPPLVLVVDDEPLIRMVMAETLLDAGFEVLEASDAHEALRLFDAASEVAVVLTDIDMPGGLNGLDLRDQLQGRAPNVPVVVTSGRGDIVRKQALGPQFLAKPFTADDLVSVVVACLKPGERPV